VNIWPGQFSQSFVNGYAAGTSFCLRAGTHYLGAPVTARDGDSYVGEYGAIVDGQSGTGTALNPGAWPYSQNVKLSGIVFKNFTATVIEPGRYWTVSHNDISGGTIGVSLEPGTVASYNRIHNSATYGVVGMVGDHTLPTMYVSNNEISFNGGVSDSGGSSGGSKFNHASIVMDHNYVHDNTGNPYSTASLWCDYDNVCTYEYNLVVHNGGAGIYQEMDYLSGNSGIIRYNTVQDDCQLFIGQGIGYCSDIQVRNSNNTSVFGNTITNTTDVNPLGIVMDSRISSMGNNYCHDNVITFGPGGVVGFQGVSDLASNHYDYDTYNAPSTSFTGLTLGSGGVTWPTWQGTGQDQHGSWH